MPSCFRQSLCLPFLFYEILSETCSEGMTEETVAEAYEGTFGDSPERSVLRETILRVLDEASGDVPKPPTGGFQKKLFGTGFMDYLSKLDGARMCFYLADFDPEKAKRFYCEIDSKLISEAAKEKIGLTSEENGVAYEAVLFGMGGSYKGHGPKDNVVDLTDDASAAIPRLKELGLM